MSRNHVVPPPPLPAQAPRSLADLSPNQQITAQQVWEAITPAQQQMLFSVLIALGRNLVRSARPHDVRSEEAGDEQS